MATRKKAVKDDVPAEPVRVEAKGRQTVLHLEAIVGVAQSKRLHAVALKLAGAGCDVHVRCEHLQHLDCAAVQVLLALSETLRSKGAALTVQNLPESVNQTLCHAGLASAL